MPGEGSVAKVCSICGIDCSAKPRTKDAQGRYICGECVGRAKETKQIQANPPKPKAAAAPGAEAGEGGDDTAQNAFLLELGGKSQALEGGKECPTCQAVLNKRDMICLACGFNLNTGKQMKVKVEKYKPAQGEEASGGKKEMSGASKVGLAAGVTLLATAGVAMGAPEMMKFLLILWCLAVVCIRLLIVVRAFQHSVTQGALVFFLPFYILFWVFIKNDDTNLKWIYFGNFVCGLIILTGAASTPGVFNATG